MTPLFRMYDSNGLNDAKCYNCKKRGGEIVTYPFHKREYVICKHCKACWSSVESFARDLALEKKWKESKEKKRFEG